MVDEESKEFETRLLHLGQDIGYMGLRVQKDVQKYIKDLKTTHDCKKFCSKLALALKRFSTYTEQYAKDLEDRINTFNKEDEYEEVKSTLKTIICSNSLGPPNNTSGDETKDPLDNDVKNEVLSQQSLHIGIDNEPKDEPLTQPQSLNSENQNVSSSNLTDLPEEDLHYNQNHSQASSTTVIYSPSNPTTNLEAITYRNNVMEEENDSYNIHIIENGDNMANSLEISHSEVVVDNEDEREVDVEIPIVDNNAQTTKSSLNIIPSNIDNENLIIPKVIPLPYQGLHENPNDNQHSENDSMQERPNVIPLPGQIMEQQRLKQMPIQCGKCQSVEILAQHHTQHHRRRALMLEVASEVQRRVRNLQNQTVIVGTVVNSALAAKHDYGKNKSTFKTLRDYYNNLVRGHLELFGLIFNEELQVIEKLVDVEPTNVLEEDEAANDELWPPPPPAKRRRRNADQICIEED